ncbi:ABC transporter transmembrane domain-containing protein [Jhaorihella thermophila]|uniref:ABC transporter transmembrane region n=1 Tax=Jhaorihella thermophila TaxID=488547 RepID=A0A1H5WQM0_9RHOB|nr:ABC transporter transmembrane domain-containing protein [Jhaorihella thermophila]SEG01247.1 ABC transporter transmembrane region [Jhaorihella thermophila]
MIALYAAIWRVSGKRQIVLILLSIAIAALAAVPLEFQRDIINLLTEGDIQPRELFLLGAGMSLAILLSLSLKWISGYRSGILGEDVIRLIRNRLVQRAREQGEKNRVPLGTLTTAISAEAEELGKFAGSAFSEPVVQIGTLVSVIGYIASTQPGLGGIALAMILPQVVLVYLSQKKVNALLAERVRVLRATTDRITAQDPRGISGAVAEDFDRIYETRRRMFLWKLSTKFLLSAINGAGMVAVLMLGGWLVLRGETDVGTVVAATMGLGGSRGRPPF